MCCTTGSGLCGPLGHLPPPHISTWVTRLSDSGGTVTKLKFAWDDKKLYLHSNLPESGRFGLVVKLFWNPSSSHLLALGFLLASRFPNQVDV